MIIAKIKWDGRNLEGEIEVLRQIINPDGKKTIIEKPIISSIKLESIFDCTNWSLKEIRVLKRWMKNSVFLISGLTDQLKKIIQKDIFEHCKKNRSFSAITGKIQQIKAKRLKKSKRPIWAKEEIEKALSLYTLGHSSNFVALELYRLKLSPILRSNQSVLQKIYTHTNYRQNPGGLPQFRKGKQL